MGHSITELEYNQVSGYQGYLDRSVEQISRGQMRKRGEKQLRQNTCRTDSKASSVILYFADW